MAALELASIVAAYLRKHGFSKTLAAFSRENGETSEEVDAVDLETLYKLYTSTQVNGNRETKKSKKAKFKDTRDMANGNKNAEEMVNEGAAPKSKKKKKGEKESLVDSLMVPEIETKNILKEEGLKKKKAGNLDKVNENTEGLKSKGKDCLMVAGTMKSSVEEALPSGHSGHDSALNKIVAGTHIENGGGLTIEEEVAHPHPPESLHSGSKKKKKEQGGEQLAGSKTPTKLPDSTQVSSQENGLSKKKRKKLKDTGEEDTTKAAIAAESACETPTNDQAKKLDVIKRPVELLGEPEGLGFSSKKKKHRKELLLESAGDINGKMQESSGVEQGGEQLAGSKTPIRLPDSTQVSSDENGLSKKKIKKVKDTGEEEMTKTAIAAESACETPTNDQAKKLDVTKRPVELLGEPGGCGFSSKKKKHRKEPSLEGAGDGNSNIQEPSGVKLEASKNEEDPFDSKNQSGTKRKHKDDTSLINGISNLDHNNSMASPEKTKGGSDVIYQCNVEKHEFDSTKINKETPNNKKTPTGALAFKRVEVEKVSFSDPRLKDNSYWAKDGAEEGYGAKAQEVLGFVRGRDFRHEKTKKKRGSYRGGLIGFESHSIKFQNSDED